MSQIELPHRMALLGAQVYNACRLGAWCFRPADKHLFYSTFPYEQELRLFLDSSGTLDLAIAQKERKGPVILTDPLGLLWIAEAAGLYENDPPMLFLFGPVFLTNVSSKYILDRMMKFQVSAALQGRYMRILQEVPVLDSSMVQQYAKMVHATIIDEYLPETEVVYISSAAVVRQEHPAAGAKTDYLRAHQLEQELLAGIREGRSDVLNQLSYPGVLHHFHTEDPIREVKNNIIIFVSLCARAAAEGGVSLQVAKEMEEDYISRVERCNAIAGLAELNHSMIREFAQRAAQCRENPGLSDAIQNCCAYIRSHCMEKLELSDISAALGYADYYLSRKFYKEMGIHLSDYINEVRLGRAKTMLATTDMSLESISERLHYTSRNYFSKVFRKYYGISPSQYRASMNDPDIT